MACGAAGDVDRGGGVAEGELFGALVVDDDGGFVASASGVGVVSGVKSISPEHCVFQLFGYGWQRTTLFGQIALARMGPATWRDWDRRPWGLCVDGVVAAEKFGNGGEVYE